MKTKIEYFLYRLLYGVRVDLVGSLAISELYILLNIKRISTWFIQSLKLYPQLRVVSKLYLMLFTSQLISEIFVSSGGGNSIKGLMVTVISFLCLIFNLMFLTTEFSLIVYVFLANIFKLVIFGDQFGFVEDASEVTYFKFYIAPILLFLLLILSSIKRFSRFSTLLLTGLGLFLIGFGARSLGLTTFLTGMVSFLIKKSHTVTLRKLLFPLVFLVLGFMLFYAKLYVPNVLSGKWGSESNKEQLEKTRDPYNPINLLLMGRSECFVGWQAFMDRPLWGFGNWTKDVNYKYTILLAEIQQLNDHKKLNLKSPMFQDQLIPSHSVFIGMGVANGIFSFLIFAILFFYVYSMGVKSLDGGSPFLYIQVYFLISTLWLALFGPVAHFKVELPTAFAVFLSLYFDKRQNDVDDCFQE